MAGDSELRGGWGGGWRGWWGWPWSQGWRGQALWPPGVLILLLLWPQLLCLIGESFEEHSQDVCGAVINIRTKRDKIAVWTREAENQEGVLHIG